MSEVVGAAAGGVGGVVWVCVCAGWRRRFLRFFFFGLTGASAGRTVEGEIPPVGPWLAVVPGTVPPLTPPPDVTGTTPPVDAEAPDVPHANASTSTTIANAVRRRFPPCMGVGIGWARTAV